ncbi:MAG: DISARM system phospholipase D-like protein DrmC [Coriobacteriia bacterium]|nr:DISARM system phospholipase D-like protein DrmC [Coriobacteriia bacterium]
MQARLAASLRSGLLVPPYTVAAVAAATGERFAGIDDVVARLEELDRQGIPPAGVSLILDAHQAVAAQALRVDFVWSGPEVSGLHARDTRRVYEELLGTATSSVWASTCAFFDGPKAFEVLSKRMDAVEDLHVVLLLNIERKWGDTTSADELVRRFADRFWGVEWPGNRRPSVFYDPRSLEVGRPAGVLHAKAVVKDDEAVFVTSANLTEAALDRNIETGLLVRDRALAMTVVAHFRGLIDKGLLVPLPEIGRL